MSFNTSFLARNLDFSSNIDANHEAFFSLAHLAFANDRQNETPFCSYVFAFFSK